MERLHVHSVKLPVLDVFSAELSGRTALEMALINVIDHVAVDYRHVSVLGPVLFRIVDCVVILCAKGVRINNSACDVEPSIITFGVASQIARGSERELELNAVPVVFDDRLLRSKVKSPIVHPRVCSVWHIQ